jgi:hypothetical protein
MGGGAEERLDLWGVELGYWTVVDLSVGGCRALLVVLGGRGSACACVSGACLCGCVCGLKCARGVYSGCGRAAWCVLLELAAPANVCKASRHPGVCVCVRVVVCCVGCVTAVATCV